MTEQPEQPTLFELPPRSVEAAPRSAELERVSAELPEALRMGTMSWTFPGWRGLVYAESADPKALSEAGLPAYSSHPLLGATEIDRSFYDPLPERYFAQVAEQVPEQFRFIVKAHEDCTVARFPKHARYGKKQGELNARFLDAAYASAS
jgi:uncharacterized protein YecE (DUF72 family)